MITKEFRNTKGITLIALVISIIVLLILAGVALNLVLGEDGITNRAVKTSKIQNISGAKEKLELQVAAYAGDFYQAKYVNGSVEASGTVGSYILEKFTNNSDFEEDYTLTKKDNKITITNKKDESQKATATIDDNAKVSWSGIDASQNEIAIGDTVTYTTKLNDTDLTMDWKVFYKETISGTDYVWIILGDYLPNSYVNISGISNKMGDYGVKSDYRTNLITAMTNTANWSSLLKGTLNGTEIDYTETKDTNIKAMGSPTLELWRDSWNEKYPNTSRYTTNQLYTATTESPMSDGYNGFYVSRTYNQITTRECSISGSGGYVSSSNADALFFPHTRSYNSADGYWLASPSVASDSYCMVVSCYGSVSYTSYWFGLRPVICLPASVFE